MVIESDKAINEDFNISTPVATSVLELAELVWNKINPDKKFTYTSDEPFAYDVQKRIPNTDKAKQILGFEAEISLEESVEEVINHITTKQ
jgi:UDP-glucose 4-epimerase